MAATAEEAALTKLITTREIEMKNADINEQDEGIQALIPNIKDHLENAPTTLKVAVEVVPNEENGVKPSAPVVPGELQVDVHANCSGNDLEIEKDPKIEKEPEAEEHPKIEEEPEAEDVVEDPPLHRKHREIKDSTCAHLEEYIIRAEKNVLGNTSARSKIFRSAPGSRAPMLRKGVPNRVIIFAGCFNPPHKAHFELLCHAFLRTDRRTIAAMILSIDDRRLKGKRFTEVACQSLVLGKAQRMSLWDDEVLGRFTWSWPGLEKDVDAFISKIQELGRRDGFELSFTALMGSDHIGYLETGSEGWGTGSVISSDITRPVYFMADGTGRPATVSGSGWNEWRAILQPKRKSLGPDEPHCRNQPCWACWKLFQVYPECFNGDFEDGPNRLAGDATGILRRCHDGKGTIWMTSRRYKGQFQYKWFLLSGRQYPTNESRLDISSTGIRKILGTTSDDEVYDKLKDIALNPGELVTMFRNGLGKQR
ncbi:Nn.00g012140.m01.CDS01 [Neocucurbitaria sp. VM-36]